MCRKQLFKPLLWKCGFPLLIGLAVYLLFHKPDLALHKCASDYFQTPNYYLLINKSPVTIFFLNHFPDCLWAYSLTCFLILYISDALPLKTKAALIIIVVSFTEIIQIFFPKQFTFDWIDLLLSIIIAFVTLIFWPYEKETSL